VHRAKYDVRRTSGIRFTRHTHWYQTISSLYEAGRDLWYSNLGSNKVNANYNFCMTTYYAKPSTLCRRSRKVHNVCCLALYRDLYQPFYWGSKTQSVQNLNSAITPKRYEIGGQLGSRIYGLSIDTDLGRLGEWPQTA